MSEVKWIKIMTDIFNNKKIRLIESMPDSDSIIVIWFKLLMLAGNVNDGGMVYFTKDIPYTDQMLATLFNRPLATVQLALSTFEKFEMIEIVNEIIKVSNWEKYQNVDRLEEIREYNRLAKQKSRAKQKLLTENVNDMSMTCQRCHDTDIDKELDIDKDSNNKTAPKAVKVKHKHGEYQHVLLTDDEFNKLATDFGESLRDKAIAFLDEYIEEKGYKSKSHNLAIRRWVIDAVKKGERNGGKQNYSTGVQSQYSELDSIERLNRLG